MLSPRNLCPSLRLSPDRYPAHYVSSDAGHGSVDVSANSGQYHHHRISAWTPAESWLGIVSPPIPISMCLKSGTGKDYVASGHMFYSLSLLL